METATILFIVLFLWLLGLTTFLLWVVWLLRGIIKDSKNSDFLKIFKNIQDVQSQNSIEIKELEKDLSGLKKEVLGHVQKVGLVKFNPFSEAGGDHSFSLSLLDGNKNGIIITSLHSRETTRVYIKDVKKGKSSIELSNEEKKALISAEK